MTDLLLALLAAALIVPGSVLMLIAAVGVLRMPAVYIRLQASTKAASLGAGCLLLALALHFGDVAVSVRALLAIAFIFLTVPISAHMIARAAYLSGVELWERTRRDDLRGRYDPRSHRPSSPPPGDPGRIPTADEEAQLLALLREGLTEREIADAMGISPDAVGVRLDAILARHGVRTRAEAVARSAPRR